MVYGLVAQPVIAAALAIVLGLVGLAAWLFRIDAFWLAHAAERWAAGTAEKWALQFDEEDAERSGT